MPNQISIDSHIRRMLQQAGGGGYISGGSGGSFLSGEGGGLAGVGGSSFISADISEINYNRVVDSFTYDDGTNDTQYYSLDGNGKVIIEYISPQ